MNILGISCFYHDSAACLIKDNKIVAAAEEERFTRVKNEAGFPFNAINFCLQQGNIICDDVDYIGFYEKPYLKFSRLIIDHLRSFPFSFKNFLRTLPFWLQDRLILPVLLEKELCYKGKFLSIKHHMSHAASCFLLSPFDQAAIITADAIGEWATTTYGIGKGNQIDILKEIKYPHSLGLLYSTVTTYLGFEANRGEGKVMGLSAYGQPNYLDHFKKIVNVKLDGSFQMDRRYFEYIKGSQLYNKNFIQLFGPPRVPESRLEPRHQDIAASLQKLVEEILINIANHVYQETKMKNLCLAGGIFLNCIANHKILENTPFENVFIQPAAGDAGGALGTAAYINNSLLGNPRENFESAYLGPQFGHLQIRRSILNQNLSFTELDDDQLVKHIVKKISENKIVGLFQGKMEIGPRALGNRSILANACNPNMKNLLNERVKKRESFRPYAPIVLEEKKDEYFELLNSSPYMLLAAQVKPEKRKLIPAVTHVDNTARIQTVTETSNAFLHKLLIEFEKNSGIPVIINTSLNLRGDPIACSPDDAINIYLKSEMDVLVLGNFVVER